MVYLSNVVEAANKKGYSLENIVFSDVEVCHECHSILFVDDEAYSTHSDNALCGSCSCRCEHCEAYFMEKELSLNSEGLSLCSTCLVKDTLDKTSLIDLEEKFLGERVIVNDEWSGRVENILRDADNSWYASVVDVEGDVYDKAFHLIKLESEDQ